MRKKGKEFFWQTISAVVCLAQGPGAAAVSWTKASGVLEDRHLVGALALRKMPDFPQDPERFLSPTQLSQAAPPSGVGVGPRTPARPLAGLDILCESEWPCYLADITAQTHVELGKASGSKTPPQPDLLGPVCKPTPRGKMTGLRGAMKGWCQAPPALPTPIPPSAELHR